MKRFILAALLVFIGIVGTSAQVPNQSGMVPNAPSPVTNPTSYLGITATRGQVATNSFGAGTATWLMSQSMFWSRDTMTNPSIVFGNFLVNTSNTEVTVGAGTIGASVCIGNATTCANGSAYTLCARGTTFPNGLTAVQCAGLSIPNNTQGFVRSLQQNTNGVLYAFPNGNSTAGNYAPDCIAFGTGTATDLLTSGTFGGGACQVLAYYPLAIVSQTTHPSVVIAGDSRYRGTFDFYTDVTADTGDIARSLGPSFGYSNISVPSTFMSGYLSGSHTYRDQLMAYASHIIVGYGINDIVSGGNTAATLATNRATFAALYPNNVVIGNTLPVVTTTSDNWVTTTNQGAANVQIATFNQLARLGIAGEQNYFDLAYAFDPSHQNLWAPAPNPFAASLTPVFAGTGSISTAAVMTITACTTCTLPIGTNIVGTGVPLGEYVISYGTNVSSAGLCTATCTYNVAAKPSPAVSAGTAIAAGGFQTNDGTHITALGEMFLKSTGAVSPNLIHR